MSRRLARCAAFQDGGRSRLLLPSLPPLPLYTPYRVLRGEREGRGKGGGAKPGLGGRAAGGLRAPRLGKEGLGVVDMLLEFLFVKINCLNLTLRK